MWLSDVSGNPSPSSECAGGLVASVSVHMKQKVECLNANYTKDVTLVSNLITYRIIKFSDFTMFIFVGKSCCTCL